MVRFVYMLVTNDKYELPVAIHHSVRELAKGMQMGYSSIYKSMVEDRACAHGKYKCIKVDLLY